MDTTAATLTDADESRRQQLAEHECAWRKGSTRRTFLQGLGMAGVAALGSQLVGTRAAYAATSEKSAVNTLVTIDLHGGVDGLRVLMPTSNSLGFADLQSARPDLVLGPADRIALDGAAGWAMNAKLAPLSGLWKSGEFAFVPGLMSPGATRSHFESLRNISLGSTKPLSTGWLDRVLAGIGPGTTFRALGLGEQTTPAAFLGSESQLVLDSLGRFAAPASTGDEERTLAAIEGLYRGVDPEAASQVAEVATALRTATVKLKPRTPDNGAKYPAGGFGRALADLATTLKAEVGLQVCAMDVGGWDTHSVEIQNLDSHLSALATGLAAFMQDLGPARRSRVTVLVKTEFGRRVAQNGTGGTDHGLGSVAMVLGGGLNRSGVYGSWHGLDPATLDHGDVPGYNHPFDLMGELAQKRLGYGSAASLFPDHTYAPIGLAKS